MCVERETGFEPATPSLEGSCSSQLSYSRTQNQILCFPVARCGGEGRIRTSVGVLPTDLQSAPFSRFGTSPAEISWAALSRPTVLNHTIKSDESPPSRSPCRAIVKESRVGLRWAVRFRRRARGAPWCARWWLLFGPRCEAGL